MFQRQEPIIAGGGTPGGARRAGKRRGKREANQFILHYPSYHSLIIFSLLSFLLFIFLFFPPALFGTSM